MEHPRAGNGTLFLGAAEKSPPRSQERYSDELEALSSLLKAAN